MTNAFGMKYDASLMCIIRFSIDVSYSISVYNFSVIRNLCNTHHSGDLLYFLRMNKQNPKQRDFKIHRTKNVVNQIRKLQLIHWSSILA